MSWPQSTLGNKKKLSTQDQKASGQPASQPSSLPSASYPVNYALHRRTPQDELRSPQAKNKPTATCFVPSSFCPAGRGERACVRAVSRRGQPPALPRFPPPAVRGGRVEGPWRGPQATICTGNTAFFFSPDSAPYAAYAAALYYQYCLLFAVQLFPIWTWHQPPPLPRTRERKQYY